MKDTDPRAFLFYWTATMAAATLSILESLGALS